MKKQEKIFFILIGIIIVLIIAGYFLFKNIKSGDDDSISNNIDYDKYEQVGFNRTQIDTLFDAIKELEISLEHNPSNFDSWLKLGTLYKTLKEYDLAMQNYLTAIEKNEAYAPGYAEAAELYVYPFENYEKAEEYYKIAIEKAPYRSDYYKWLADLYRNEFPEKKNEIEQLMIDGANYDLGNALVFYSYLVDYYSFEDNISKAIYYANKSLAIEPDNENLKRILADLNSRQ